MDLNFRPVEAEDMSRLRPFYGLRPNRTCDSVFLDSFLWKDYYKVWLPNFLFAIVAYFCYRKAPR